MKGIKVVGKGKLVLEDLPIPDIKEREVLIRVEYVGICGSDLHRIELGNNGDNILGHEFSGIVVAKGENCQNVSMGDLVTASPVMGCTHCSMCEKGLFRFCREKKVLGFDQNGALAEFVKVPKDYVIRVLPGIAAIDACLIEHFCCAQRIYSQSFEGQLPRSTKILIIGDGPMALANVQILKSASYDHIWLQFKHKQRGLAAHQLGAKIFDYQSFDKVAIDCINVCILSCNVGPSIHDILKKMAPGSQIIIQSRTQTEDFINSIVTPEIQIKGAFAYELNDFYDVMNLMINRRIKTSILKSSILNFEGLPAGVDRLFMKDDFIKRIVSFDQSLVIKA